MKRHKIDRYAAYRDICETVGLSMPKKTGGYFTKKQMIELALWVKNQAEFSKTIARQAEGSCQEQI
jgi:hypothetical protein